jgi:structural maintenance of chromosome 2
VQILSEEITPLTETLRKQKDQYIQWAANNQEMERLTRFCIAAEYQGAEEHLTASEGEMANLEASLQSKADLQEELEEKVVSAEEKVGQLKEEKTTQVAGEVKETEQQAQGLSKVLVKKNSEMKNAKDTLAAEIKSRNTLEKTVDQTHKAIETKKQDHAAGVEGLVQHEEAYRAAAQDVTDAENRYAAMSAGASATGGSSKSLAEELADCKRADTEAVTATKQAEMKVKHLEKTKKEVAAKLGKATKDSDGDAKKLVGLKKEQDALEKTLNKMSGSIEEAEVANKKHIAETKVSQISERVETIESRLSGLEFPYSDPEPGFDRARVKGRVATLTKVKDPSTTTAVEVAAGGKLFQVVVDSQDTAKKLLNKGKLKHRITLIPLNKIDTKTLSKERLEAAQSAAGGPELCKLAMDLVGYDAEVANAMKYTFGNTVVCPNSEAARRATFDKDAKVKSVTFDGDMFDPSGTLTGGSRHNASDSVLSRIVELQDARVELAAAQANLQVPPA